MSYEEVWAIPLDRIAGFFLRQPGLVPSEGILRWQDCTVILKELPPRPMGPWPLPQTQVRIEGPKEQADELHRRFFLTFVSAGGLINQWHREPVRNDRELMKDTTKSEVRI